MFFFKYLPEPGPLPRASYLFGILAWAGLLLPSAAMAQQDTLTRGVIRANPEIEAVEDPGRYLYFMIGIDQYEHWFTLRNAVEDARGFERSLAENFGFQQAYPTLLDREATKANILNAMDKLYQTLLPTDNLIIFFAGHGHTRVDTVGNAVVETGFLIPNDGRPPASREWASYLYLDHFLGRAALLPARHITVVLDACHSGFALGENATSYRGFSDFGREITQNISRRVITSARSDQLAQDSGPLADHSLFTGMLLEALESGRCDLNGDFFITTSEIGLYIEQEVNKYSGGMQTPDFGAFKLDQRGEMILALNDDSPEMLLRRADAQLLRGELDDFFETFQRIEEKKLPLPAYYRLRYRAALLQQDGQMALQTLRDILRDHTGDLNPREVFEVSRLLPHARYWQNVLSLPLPAQHTLEPVARQNGAEVPITFSEKGIFSLPMAKDGPYTIELTNVSDRPVYLYALYVDGYADEVMQLHGAKHEPLPPGATWVSPPYENEMGVSYQEFHLVISPEPIEALQRPPDHLLTQILPPYEPPAGASSAVVFMHFK